MHQLPAASGDIQGPGVTSGGIRTRGWPSAAANHGGNTRCDRSFNLLRTNKVNVAVDAASRENHSFPATTSVPGPIMISTLS